MQLVVLLVTVLEELNEITQNMDVIFANLKPSSNIYIISKNKEVLYDLFQYAVILYKNGDFYRLSKFLDAIHALPEAMIYKEKWNRFQFRKIYLKTYKKEFDSNFSLKLFKLK